MTQPVLKSIPRRETRPTPGSSGLVGVARITRLVRQDSRQDCAGAPDLMRNASSTRRHYDWSSGRRARACNCGKIQRCRRARCSEAFGLDFPRVERSPNISLCQHVPAPEGANGPLWSPWRTWSACASANRCTFFANDMGAAYIWCGITIRFRLYRLLNGCSNSPIPQGIPRRSCSRTWINAMIRSNPAWIRTPGWTWRNPPDVCKCVSFPASSGRPPNGITTAG